MLILKENVRFNKDFASYDRFERERIRDKNNEVIENKRAAHLARETEKWMKMDHEFEHANDVISKKKELFQDVGTYGNGMAFNPITLEYHDGQKGNQLRERDEQNQFRAKLRAKNLDYRGNSSYNVVTGEDRKGVDLKEDIFMKYAKDMIVPRKRTNNIW